MRWSDREHDTQWILYFLRDDRIFQGRIVFFHGRWFSHCCEMADKSAHHSVMAPWCQFELGRRVKCSSWLSASSLFTGAAVVAPRRIKDLCVYLGLEYVRKDLWEMPTPAWPSFIPWGVVTDDTGNQRVNLFQECPYYPVILTWKVPNWRDLILTFSLKLSNGST